MRDNYQYYKMLTETAKICPDENCKQIILREASELQALGYADNAPILDIIEDEIKGE